MQRFSRLFWFTVLAGTLSAALFSYGLLSCLGAHLNEMTTLCTARNDSCSAESIDRAFHLFFVTEMAGTLLLFWFAHRIGLRFIQPAPPTVTGAAG